MTQLALKRPVTTLMVAVAVCLLGYLSWRQLPVQLLPQLILPEIYVGGGLPGGSPEEVERTLAIPVEGEIATLDGVRDIETRVQPDFFSTKVTFDPGTDMRFAVLKLQQKMTALEQRLTQPARIEINRFDTADLSTYLMQISIRGDRELNALRDIAERRIAPQLEKVDGVINVNVSGGQQNNIGIVIDEARCQAVGVPLEQVKQKIDAYHRQPAHLGQVIATGRVLDVNLIGRVDDLWELRHLVITADGKVRLQDVASVDYSQAERDRLFRINGKAGVGILIQKDNISNMLRVARDVQVEIDRLNDELRREGLELVVNFSQAALIQEAIDRIGGLAITGAFLALIVLFLFLRNIRFVSILMLAIPVSLLATANFMYGWELSINIVSLCGLALAIGMLVDNGIVVMENIFSRYQHGASAREAVRQGTREVSRSIFAATGTTVLVFLPILFVESEAQLFVRELALAVIFPLTVSLVVALTLIPLLASWTLRGKPLQVVAGRRIMEIYRLLLKSAIRHRIRTVATVAILLVLSLLIGVTFILRQAPPPPPDRLDVFVTLPQGSTLDRTDEMVRQLEEQIVELPDLQEARASIQAGEANLGITFVEPGKRSKKLELDKIKNQLRAQAERLDGVDVAFERPRTMGGMAPSSGGADFAGLSDSEKGLRLRGYDLQTLRSLSEQIRETLLTIPDIDPRSVQSELRSGAPEVQIIGDRLRLALWGLSMQQVMASIWNTRAEGTRAATPYYQNGTDVDMQLQLAGVDERQLNDLREARVTNAAGQSVPLREVAEIRTDEGAGDIVRYNQERQAKITYRFSDEASTSKARLEAAEAQVDLLLREMRLPRGFTLEKLAEEDRQTIYYWMLGIGALLIYMFLAAQFESFFSPVVILGTIPTAIIGSLLALTLTGTPLSLGESAPMALLGLIVLLGIVVNNGIILLDRIAILRQQHGYRWQRAVMVASQNRVRPILMTSATTILGVFPLALKQGTEFEIWPPFAITVLGGLAVSSLSTLIFIPVLYVGLEQTKNWLQRIGWIGIIAATVVATALLTWYYQRYESVLYTVLLALPVWFGLLGLIHLVQQFFQVKQAQKRMRGEKLRIQISNLTKIYGAPGRFMREWLRQQRRTERLLADDALPWQRQQVRETTIWLAVIGAVIFYLHTFLDSRFWLTLLTLATLGWLWAARELYYQWRFLLGRPPRDHRLAKRLWQKLRRRPLSDASEAVEPADYARRGGLWFALLAGLYLHVRVESIPVTVIYFVLVLLVQRFYRIGRKIEAGRINPELPEGRLKKIKRGIYTLVKVLPVIRPPRPQVVALHGVNLDIGAGMFGLLGPNGAGKTTLMRTVVGVLDADRGSIKINGRDLNEHRAIYHGAIGYLPQDFGLYENMSPVEFLNYHAMINGIYQPDERRALIDRLLQDVGLWERRDDNIKTFSGGMKQRVGIAQTLLNLPQIIVVDEPTAGLDPKERIRFRNLLGELAKERIVLFSTHIVEDISSTCKDIAVLNRGRVLYNGSPQAMQQMAQGKVFEAIVPEAAFDTWRQQLQIVQHSKSEAGVRVRFISEEPVAGLDARAVEPTLEDAYVLLLRRGKQNGRAASDKANHSETERAN